MKQWYLSFFILRLRQRKHDLAPQGPHHPSPYASLRPKPNSPSPPQPQLKSKQVQREGFIAPLPAPRPHRFFSGLYRTTSLDLKVLCLLAPGLPFVADCHFSKVSGSPRGSLGWQRKVGWIDRPAQRSRSMSCPFHWFWGFTTSPYPPIWSKGSWKLTLSLITGSGSWSPI